ncbi:hypothetical protein N9Y33_05110 [Bacteroidia bacterium]|jgi:hypothetical protein|nr:hypothetical protein [Bacteroidia bacterium]
MKKVFIIVLILAVLAFAVVSFFLNKKTDLVVEDPAEYTFTVNEFVEEGLTSNDSLFNAKYVGKVIEIKGEIKLLNKDVQNPSLQFNTNDESIVVNTAFDKSVYDKVKALSQGEGVSLTCICNGLSLPEDPDDLLSETIFTFNRCNINEIQQNEEIF